MRYWQDARPPGVAQDRRPSQYHRLERLVGRGILAPRRTNSAHLHRPWRATARICTTQCDLAANDPENAGNRRRAGKLRSERRWPIDCGAATPPRKHPGGADSWARILDAAIVASSAARDSLVKVREDAMIDNPDQVDRLIATLRQSLPLFATVTPEVAAAMISEESPAADPLHRYAITRVDYAGDEGGIVCKVELGPENGDRALFASITHLQFGRAGSIGRQIAAYQKTSGQTLAACGLRNPGLTGVRAMTRRAKSKGSAALATGSDAWP